MQKSKFDLISLVVIVVLLVMLTLMLFPAISASQVKSNTASVAARGKDIYVAITSSNTDREPLGLPSVWPKSNPPTNNAVDISKMNFANSTDYFWSLYDGNNIGTRQHDPYVRGFDFSKLAGAGVKVHTGQDRLKPENNMWTIAKNVRDEMEDIIPVLVTRNVAAETLVTDLTTVSDRRLFFDEEWKTPFGRKGFVIIRKGGGTYNLQARYMTYRVLYNDQIFKTTIPGSQAPRLGYLTPSKEVTPSEDVYQACATAYEKRWKWHRYERMKEALLECLPVLKYYLFLSLISGVFIFVRVFFDKQLKEPLSVVGPVNWILLWLAVTSYMYCPVMAFWKYAYEPILFALVLAPIFQIAGCLYMVAWKRRTGNLETYRMAFGLMVLAPVLALQCLLTLAVVVVFPVKHILFFGLVSGFFIRIRISDKTKLTPPFSVMGPLYWVLLWLAVTAYMCCPVILLTHLHHQSLIPTLFLAGLSHVLSCLYIVVCNRRSGNKETFKTVLLAICIAPVLACQSLIITAALVLFFEYCRSFFCP